MDTQRMHGKALLAVLVMLALFGMLLIAETARSFARGDTRASLMQQSRQSASGAEVSLSSGARGIFSKDAASSVSEDQTIRLEKGSLTLIAPLRATVLTHAARIDLLGSAAYIVADDAGTTVAALQSSVLVQSTSSVILPEGHQITYTGLQQTPVMQVIPAFWLPEKQASLAALSVQSPDFSLQSSDDIRRELSYGTGTALSAFTAFRLLEEVQTPDTANVLVGVLRQSHTLDTLSASLLSLARQASRPLPESLVSLLEEKLSQHIAAHPSESAEILSSVHATEAHLLNIGFPRSSEVWGQMEQRLRSLAAPFLPSVSPSKEEVHAGETGTTVLTAIPLHPRDAEQMARTIIRQYNFLFTVDTSFSPVANVPNTVHVLHLQYAGKAQHTLSFDLNVTTSVVSHVEMDGQRLPNELPLPDFVRSL